MNLTTITPSRLKRALISAYNYKKLFATFGQNQLSNKIALLFEAFVNSVLGIKLENRRGDLHIQYGLWLVN